MIKALANYKKGKHKFCVFSEKHKFLFTEIKTCQQMFMFYYPHLKDVDVLTAHFKFSVFHILLHRVVMVDCKISYIKSTTLKMSFDTATLEINKQMPAHRGTFTHADTQWARIGGQAILGMLLCF